MILENMSCVVFLSFPKKNQQCDFAALLSSSLFFPLGFIFLSPSLFLILFCLSYFLKGSGWLPLIIISWMLWLWAKMLIVKHEAKMNGFSPISLHTLPPVVAYEGEDEHVCCPDFANILWLLEEQGRVGDIKGKMIVRGDRGGCFVSFLRF